MSVSVGAPHPILTLPLPRPSHCRYHLFGPTVDMAMQLERTGEKGRLHISQSTRDLLAVHPRFIIKEAEEAASTPFAAAAKTYYVVAKGTVVESQA